jgi:hypothetical protein
MDIRARAVDLVSPGESMRFLSDGARRELPHLPAWERRGAPTMYETAPSDGYGPQAALHSHPRLHLITEVTRTEGRLARYRFLEEIPNA